MKSLFKLRPTWWMNPYAVVLMVTIPFTISGELLTGSSYQDLWRTQKYIDKTCVLLIGITLACFGIGYWFSRFLRGRRKIVSAAFLATGPRFRQMFMIASALTLFGYGLWSILLVIKVGPGAILHLMAGGEGAAADIRHSESTVSGVTTSTQFGMAAMILGALILRERRDRFVKFLMVCIGVLSVARAFVWSERLSMLEIVIPASIVYFSGAEMNFSRAMLFVTRIAPVFASVGLYFYFTVFEYFRSWSTYYQGGGMNIFTFAWFRIAGYYITALNNGYLMFREQDTLPLPYFSLGWFWKFPGIESGMPYSQVTGVDTGFYDDLLKGMANREFNNGSGIFPYFLDFGYGVYLYWLILGCLAGYLYRGFRRGQLSGLLFFPFVFMGMMEFSRIPYLSTARAMPSWAFLILTFFVLKTTGRGQRHGQMSALHRAAMLRAEEVEAGSSTG